MVNRTVSLVTSATVLIFVFWTATDVHGAYVDVVTSTPGLVSYWRLGESGPVESGVTAVADSYGSNLGVYYGGATLAQNGIPNTTGENTAALFDGSTGYVSIPDDTSLSPGTGQFSVELWFKTSTFGKDIVGELLEMQEQPSGDIYQIWKSSAGVLRFDINDRNGSGGSVTAAVSWSFGDGQWHHVVGVRKTDAVQVWVDGVLKDNKSYGVCSIDPNTPLLIATGNNGSYTGLIDEVAYYSTALDGDAILAHYRAGMAVPEPSSLAILWFGLAWMVAFGGRQRWNPPRWTAKWPA